MHTSDATSQKYLIWLTELVPSLHQVFSSDESHYSSCLICTGFGISPNILHFIYSYSITVSFVVKHGVICHFPTIFTAIYPIFISWGSKIPQGVSVRRNIVVGLTCSPFIHCNHMGKQTHSMLKLIKFSNLLTVVL